VSEVRIVAEPRTEFGKGAARRIRRARKVPAVLYGHGTDPRHISLPGHELMLALKTPNVLLTLEVQGTTELALPKDIQRDPIKGFLEHVDLLLVRRGEKVKVEIPLHVVGEVVSGGLVTNELTTLEVEAEATNIPQAFEIDIEGREIGTQVLAKDIVLPPGVTLMTDPEHLVLHITAAPTAEEREAELAEAEAEAGIEREEPQAEAEAAPAPEAVPERPAAGESAEG
jgi:large subunit ribosomal protein L25